MIEKAERGKRYKVISDDENIFKPGDVVVALECSSLPLCVLEAVFKEKNYSFDICKYNSNEFGALWVIELEELEDENRYEKKLEISKMLTISTAHITPETYDGIVCAYFDGDDEYITYPFYLKDGYGWFICTDENYANESNPECIKDCMKFAREHGCDWLCLDSDGPIVDGLPVYEWKK
jgi:hypothetical protein